MPNVDAWVAQALAHLLSGHPAWQRVLVVLSETTFTKTLFFSPILIILWLRGSERNRERILVLCASCAVALAPVWLITSQWIRYKPIHPEHGVADVSAAFAHYFAAKPDYLLWGSFPSDNAAFLGALSFGLVRLRPRVGYVALLVTVGLNGLFRMAVGLHYLSDVLAGAALGWLASVACFRLSEVPVAARWLTGLCGWIGRHRVADGLVVVFLVELAVMFHDLRFLDPVLFGAIAPLP